MTTILALQRAGHAVIGGDGQVTLGHGIQKHGAVKVRALADGRVLAGFAGGAADALTLMERFESHLGRGGDAPLRKAAVELAREWRSDRRLRRLEAVLVVADASELLLVTGTGDVIAPDDGVLATGSGGNVALGAARALLRHADLPLEEVCRAALAVTAEIDLYTNDHVTVLSTGARTAT
ncbi:MAG: ATP-dependent protease subunit HslV [Planctomycetota bacterium]